MISIKSISSFSCIGPRPNQEDYVIAPDDKSARIFILCDGMGGHGHGEVASKTIADSVHHYLIELNAVEYTEEDLQNAVDFGIKELMAADIYDDEKAMGTTLVIIVVNRMNVLVGHIGDSRCYLFSDDGVKKFRSKDHSMVQEAVDAEILTEEEAWNSPKKNILTRCITSKKSSVKIEIDKLQIENNDSMMLCSDGVTDALKDSQIQSIIVGRPSEDAANIIKTECEISSHDNFSLILISFSQDEKNEKPVTPGKPDMIINYCPHCGRELADTANFCPSCGLACSSQHSQREDEISHSHPRNTFMSKMMNINPLWMLTAGILIGCVVSGLVVSRFGKSQTQVKEIVTSPPSGENVISESKLDSFISEICLIDTVNAPNDTLVSKQILYNEYQNFTNGIQKKHK